MASRNGEAARVAEHIEQRDRFSHRVQAVADQIGMHTPILPLIEIESGLMPALDVHLEARPLADFNEIGWHSSAQKPDRWR